MQFFAITRRKTESFSEADFAAVLDAEAHRAATLYAEGVFRSLHTRGDVPGAVIGIEALDREAAQAALDSLPLAKLGMMEVQLVPVLPYRGFVPKP